LVRFSLGRKENELAQEGETVNTKQPSPVMLSCAEGGVGSCHELAVWMVLVITQAHLAGIVGGVISCAIVSRSYR